LGLRTRLVVVMSTLVTPGIFRTACWTVRLDLGLERARTRRQHDREPDLAAVHLDALDHAERDEVAMQVGVIHRAERGEDGFSRDQERHLPTRSGAAGDRRAGECGDRCGRWARAVPRGLRER
jgi:hypothetical protein